MAFYNLRERSSSVNLTDFEAYYDYSEYCGYRHLQYHFNVYFDAVYYFAKSLGDKGDEFINDLKKLREDFYNIMYDKMNKCEIADCYYKSNCKDYNSPCEKDIKKIYDIFLPMQKEFAVKWGLEINDD